MFQHRQWPEGFEFPSCENCNLGTNDHDLLISMLARMDPFEEKGNQDGKLEGLMKMAKKQYPGMFERMMLTASEARRHNRELGLQPQTGQTHQQVGAVKLTPEIHTAVSKLALKLAKGMFYRESGKIFPNNGCLLLNWFTNSELLSEGKYNVFDLLKELGGVSPPLFRSGRFLNDQFEYKLSISPDKDIFIIQARFGNSFGLVIFGSTIPSRLESIVTNLRQQTERNGPFAILQSPILT